MQYAAARIRSILRKAGVLEGITGDGGRPAAGAAGTPAAGTPEAEASGGPATAIAVVEPAERALALHLLEFDATLNKVRDALEPHRLCGYLFELAQLFTHLLRPVPGAQSRGIGPGLAAGPVRAGAAPPVRRPGPAGHRNAGEHVSPADSAAGSSAPGGLTAVEAARIAVDTLLAAGVRHVVVSPGSRSAPMAYALAEADAAGRVELLVRIDERSPASRPWAWPCPPVRPPPSSPRPGPPSAISCRPSWRPTTPRCRSWSSPPTGPRNCGGPAPTRPPCSWTSSASTSASPSTCPPAAIRSAPSRRPSAPPPEPSRTPRPGRCS